MENIKLNQDDLLIIDPCYIKKVTACGDDRYDALKLVKELDIDGDGEYNVAISPAGGCDRTFTIGVDSGRLWILKAEFDDIDVSIDAGLSGYKCYRADEKMDYTTAYVFTDKEDA